MAEEKELTFDMPAPTLSFGEPVVEEKVEETKAPTQEEIDAITPEEQKLTSAELEQVEAFSQQIDLANTNGIMQYGAGAQKNIADFSSQALGSVRTKDLGTVGKDLAEVVTELKSFDAEEDKGIFGFFKRGANKVIALRAKYEKADDNIKAVEQKLEGHQVQLLKDIAMLDKMYEMNLAYFKNLSMYILAGKKKIEHVKTVELPALQAKAKETGLQEDAQAVNDLMTRLDRFEKKVYDLELTRTISLQMGPQIRLLQNNDTLMSEKIQSTLVNTIPLWRNQMVIALGIAHSQEALNTTRATTEMTNELLKKNAENLKMATIETAKESERGIVDIETLKATNNSLITTLDEVIKIQEEGRKKRADAEVEMAKMEAEMKEKLINMNLKR
ncbi:MAG: toxic anion resistance protein [Lachnospiraceae bacterium]|nr:toxic anion resistance protein [Lachnospiraceae bacterium]